MITECQTCGQPLPPKSRPGGKPRRYCSPDCKRIARHIKQFGRKPRERLGDLDRFLGLVTKDATGCWLWNGGTDAKGYGLFGMQRSSFLAHRASYILLVGPIPNGLDLDHLCCTRNCVNPDHLEPVTRAENSRRGSLVMGERSLTCGNGHEWTAENTVRYGTRQRRYCRACQREGWRRTYRRARERALEVEA